MARGGLNFILVIAITAVTSAVTLADPREKKKICVVQGVNETTVTMEMERLIQGTPPPLQRRLAGLIRVSSQRNFNDAPIVRYLVEAIARGDRRLEYFQDAYFGAVFTRTGNTAVLAIKGVVASAALQGARNAIRNTWIGRRLPHSTLGQALEFGWAITRSRGEVNDSTGYLMDPSLSHIFYGIFRGLGLYVRDHPEVRDIRIDAGKVLNTNLNRSLRGFGFTNPFGNYPDYEHINYLGLDIPLR